MGRRPSVITDTVLEALLRAPAGKLSEVARGIGVDPYYASAVCNSKRGLKMRHLLGLPPRRRTPLHRTIVSVQRWGA